MREIKFRAWDRKPKKMYYSEMEQFDDMLGFRFKHFEELDEPPVYMEYTGIKDINGKEIYEGDIVTYRINEAGLTQDDIGIIQIRDVIFDCDCDEIIKVFSLDEYTPLFSNQKCKVLGNIYENPQLIEKEKGDDEDRD